MSAGTAYWQDGLSAAEVVDIIAAQWAEEAFCQLEKVEAVKLDRATAAWLAGLQAQPESLWPRGRVFHTAAEVRWEPSSEMSGTFRAMVVSEESLAALGESWRRHDFDEVVEGRALLWGERRKGDAFWKEERIPKPLTYTVAWSEDKPMAALETRDYFQRGVIRLTRFVRVVAIPRPEVKP